jgi:ferritin-like metal-binding protein YciE
MFSWSKNTNKTRFIKTLNELFSLENAVLERLDRRMQETLEQEQEAQSSLQHQLQEAKEQQSRLRKLISDYGGRPTNSKAELPSLDSLTNTTMDVTKKKNNVLNDTKIDSKSNSHGHDNSSNKDNDSSTMSSQEREIFNTKEDALIKNAEILAYKRALQVAEKINDKDAAKIIKQNLQEKESTYSKIKSSEHKMFSKIRNNNNNNNNNEPSHEYFNLGSTVADMLTSYWNSKENPSKVYLFNRRVHHGTIGALLGLSGLYKNSAMVTGILSGLGAGLQKDDYNDFKEWFLFKKREDEAKESR